MDLVFYWKAIPKLKTNTRNENYNCRGEKRNIVNYEFLNNGRLKHDNIYNARSSRICFIKRVTIYVL